MIQKPGREIVLRNFVWIGGSLYWLSSSFIETIENSKILELKNLFVVIQLPNKIAKVNICNLKKYWDVDSHEKLLKFRDILNISKSQVEYYDATNKTHLLKR